MESAAHRFGDDASAVGKLVAVFTAALQATEKAIVNAMVGAETVIGAGGLRVLELPEDQVRAIFSTSH